MGLIKRIFAGFCRYMASELHNSADCWWILHARAVVRGDRDDAKHCMNNARDARFEAIAWGDRAERWSR